MDESTVAYEWRTHEGQRLKRKLSDCLTLLMKREWRLESTLPPDLFLSSLSVSVSSAIVSMQHSESLHLGKGDILHIGMDNSVHYYYHFQLTLELPYHVQFQVTCIHLTNKNIHTYSRTAMANCQNVTIIGLRKLWRTSFDGMWWIKRPQQLDNIFEDTRCNSGTQNTCVDAQSAAGQNNCLFE